MDKCFCTQMKSNNNQDISSDKSCIGFGVESSSGMESDNSSGDETLTDPLYENFKREKAYKAVPPPIDWVDSDDEETVLNSSETQKKTVLNSENSETSFKNRSSYHMTPYRTQRQENCGNHIWVKSMKYVDNKQYSTNGNPEEDLKDYVIIDSGCSGSMTGDKDKLLDFKDYKG
ncbi:hypothetical protein Tco_0078570 [Tanacetum coccineum]